MSIGRIAPRAACVALLLALGACSTPKGVRAPSGDDSTIGRGAGSAARGGGYYLDDGPGHLSPAEVLSVPDAVPRPEPVLARTSRPYTVFGRTYRPMNALVPYRERGIASWYGRRYHGRPTSSGEPYDMYAMTAAHPTLPIPSYVRVTRLSNGRSVVVRVNDRGPFLQNRLIDLSYTAAAKLGFVEAGSAEVEVEAITEFDAPLRVVDAGGPAGAVAASVAPAHAGAVPTASPGATATQPVAHTIPAHSGAGAAVHANASGASAPLPSAVPASDVSSSPVQRAEAPPQRLLVETQVAAGSSAAGELSMRSDAASASSPVADPPVHPAAGGPSPFRAMPSASPPSAAQSNVGSGYWLQFGAFGSAEGARNALERLRRELAWLGAQFDVHVEGRFHKVQAGPWPQRRHALDAAARVRRATALEPFTVFR